MERLTEKDNIGAFHYRLKRKHKSNEFNCYDAFFDYHMAIKRLGELEDAVEVSLYELERLRKTIRPAKNSHVDRQLDYIKDLLKGQ